VWYADPICNTEVVVEPDDCSCDNHHTMDDYDDTCSCFKNKTNDENDPYDDEIDN
jgi:hypothetical protein